jgi:hypothetical protein
VAQFQVSGLTLRSWRLGKRPVFKFQLSAFPISDFNSAPLSSWRFNGLVFSVSAFQRFSLSAFENVSVFCFQVSGLRFAL